MSFGKLSTSCLAGLIAVALAGIPGARGQVSGVWLGEDSPEIAYALIGSENETANLVLRCQDRAYDIFIQTLSEPRGVRLRDEVPAVIRLDREQQVKTSVVMTAKGMFAIRFEKNDRRFGLSLAETKRIEVTFNAGDASYSLAFVPKWSRENTKFMVERVLKRCGLV